MILKFELSQKELEALALSAGEEVLYVVPYDCDLSGNYVKEAFTVVTNKRLVLLHNAVKEKEYNLSDYDAVKAEPRINCGVLYAVKDGQDYLIVRYSSKHLARYAYVARGVALLQAFLKANKNAFAAREAARRRLDGFSRYAELVLAAHL